MLTKMIRTEEPLGHVTFAKFMDMIKMRFQHFVSLDALELLGTVATDTKVIGSTIEGFASTGEIGTGPIVSTQVKRVLMALSFVPIFESVWTISA
jgi:hypothetical protein